MRLFLLLLLLAVLLAVPFLLWGDTFEISFSRATAVRWIEGLGIWGAISAVGLLVLDLVLPVPTTAVISALGYLYGPLWGGLLGLCGSVLSGVLAYVSCRALGRKSALWLAGERDLRRGEDFFARSGGGWAVVLSRWMPLLPEVVACFAGLVRMPAPRFLLALLTGSVPMAFVFAAVGALGVANPIFALVLSAGLPLLLWPLVMVWLRRRCPQEP